jgi:hypothetical protein
MGSRLAGLAAIVAAASCLAAPVASAAQTPAQLRASILAAGRTQQSVHYVSSSVTPKTSVTIDARVGLSAGVQRITFTKSGKVGHATVLVSASTAYLHADAFTLRNYMGFKAASSTHYGNHWIAIPSTHRLFAPVSAAVTLASAIDELLPTATGRKLTAVGASTVGGTRVIGVRATSFVRNATQVDTLYARAKGAPLPVKEVATQGKAFTFTLTFDSWNARVQVAVPKSTVPIAKVLAAGGPTA